MERFIELFLPVLFTIIFIGFGIFYLRRKNIPLSYARASILIFYISAVIDLVLRVSVTYSHAFPDRNPLFQDLQARALLIPGVERMVTSYVVMSLIALSLFLILFWLNRKRGGNLLDEADILTFIFGVLAIGWPNFLLYVFLVFAFAVIWQVGAMIVAKKGKTSRMPVTPFFALAGIIIIFYGAPLSQLTGLYALR